MTELHSFPSSAVGGIVEYRLLEGTGSGPRSVLYLLHGRGDSMASWEPVLDDLRLLPIIAVLPDAPWSSRAGYYVDSADSAGPQVETAFARDLVRDVEERLGTAPTRDARIVAGYSMGGYGAVRLALAHPELFGAAVALSPAVYVPEPPTGSSAREFGAFGRGNVAFDPVRYTELNYPALLEVYPSDRRLDVVVAVGDAEPAHPGADQASSMEAEAVALVAALRRTPGISAALHRYPGGHDFTVWRPALLDALRVTRSSRQ